MKTITWALAAVVSMTAGAALADGLGRATLQSPLATPIKVIAGDAQWTCQASSCLAPSAQDEVMTVQACKTLVKAAGPLTQYGLDEASLPASLLARCNGAASRTEAANGR